MDTAHTINRLQRLLKSIIDTSLDTQPPVQPTAIDIDNRIKLIRQWSLALDFPWEGRKLNRSNCKQFNCESGLRKLEERNLEIYVSQVF